MIFIRHTVSYIFTLICTLSLVQVFIIIYGMRHNNANFQLILHDTRVAYNLI